MHWMRYLSLADLSTTAPKSVTGLLGCSWKRLLLKLQGWHYWLAIGEGLDQRSGWMAPFVKRSWLYHISITEATSFPYKKKILKGSFISPIAFFAFNGILFDNSFSLDLISKIVLIKNLEQIYFLTDLK